MKDYLKDVAEIIVDQKIKGHARLKIPLDFALGLRVGDVIVFESSVSNKPYWVIDDENYEKLGDKTIKLTQRVIIDDQLRFLHLLINSYVSK
jgi:hypothetical protein